MKNFSFLFICFFAISTFVNAQNKTITIIESMQQNEATISITITSTTPFYIGGNAYILHIGKKEFRLNKQVQHENYSAIIFYVDDTDFATLNEGEDVWLTYGNTIKKDEMIKSNVKKASKESPRTCWDLGNFDPTQLNK